MYYRSKLNIHNFTLYNLKSHTVLNYQGTEVHGDLESDNFRSIYNDYIKMQLEAQPTIKEIIIRSDGCTYQNRCCYLSSLLFSIACIGIVIMHKYLEIGHTHMECDSVHSKIEAKLKSMSHLIESARKKGGKYQVRFVAFSKDLRRYHA